LAGRVYATAAKKYTKATEKFRAAFTHLCSVQGAKCQHENTVVLIWKGVRTRRCVDCGRRQELK